MAVETYLIEEVSEMIIDSEKTEEWHKYVEELGLKGQEKLANPGKSPIPFPQLKVNEERVYTILCPRTTKLQDYTSGTIPLRVLSMAALCKQEEYFTDFEVWHNGKEPDPVLIGRKKAYDSEKYLIARWGDELCSYAELEKRALKKWIEDRKRKLTQALNQIENDASKYVEQGDWVPSI